VKKIFIAYLSFLCFFVNAQPLGPKELKDIRGATSASCFTTQRSTPVNSIMSDSQIRLYCSCYAETLMVPSITIQDLQNAMKLQQSSGNEAMLKVFLKGRDLYAIGNACAAQAAQISK
jgi:hypothetical protein